MRLPAVPFSKFLTDDRRSSAPAAAAKNQYRECLPFTSRSDVKGQRAACTFPGVPDGSEPCRSRLFRVKRHAAETGADPARPSGLN
jgi:hypothetical protein